MKETYPSCGTAVPDAEAVHLITLTPMPRAPQLAASMQQGHPAVLAHTGIVVVDLEAMWPRSPGRTLTDRDPATGEPIRWRALGQKETLLATSPLTDSSR